MSAFEREELKINDDQKSFASELVCSAGSDCRRSNIGRKSAARLRARRQPLAHSMPAFPLKLSANHRYLVDQNNKPFLIVGDSPQGLMGRLSPDEVEKYFADRQARGFNTAGWVDVCLRGTRLS